MRRSLASRPEELLRRSEPSRPVMCVMGVATPMQPKYRLPLATLPWPAPNPAPCPALTMRALRKAPMLSTAVIRPATTATRPAIAAVRPVAAGGRSHSTSRPTSAGGGTHELRREASRGTASLHRTPALPQRVREAKSAQTMCLERSLPPRSERRDSGGLLTCVDTHAHDMHMTCTCT